MKKMWTPEQLEAINKEGTNIIVSAGAGSGKTAVLSERVLRKVREGADIREILILTFTNEAAGEMKNRIRELLREAGLKEQLEYIDSAYITTFDAFALATLKKYHYLFNISKGISIIDSSVINLEKKRILDEIFLEYYEAKNEDFLKLIGDFTNRSDEIIRDAILKISKSLDLKYDKKEFLESYVDIYFRYIKGIVDELESDVYSLEGLVDDKLYQKVYDAYSDLFGCKDYDQVYKADIKSVQFRGVDEEVIPIKEKIAFEKEEIKDLTCYSKEELKEQLISTKPYLRAIVKIILELDERVFAYKREREAFEFNDVAKMAIKIVRDNPGIREEIKRSYKEILIDEYQDTNDLQEMFISEIENNNVYMVGDIKQSIYRFRNANPDIFKEKYLRYKDKNGGEKIDLLKNFRSREEVLNNINEIFNLLMTEECGRVNYQDNHAMVFGNRVYHEAGENGYNNNLEILTYDNKQDFSDAEAEAFIIAKDILKKVDNKYQVYDFGLKEKRDAQYKDFCIILDRGTDMPIYKKIFEYLNIPMDVYLDSNLTEENDILIIKNIISLLLLVNEKDKEKVDNYNKLIRYYFVSIARSFIGNMEDDFIFEQINEGKIMTSEIFQKIYKLCRGLDNKTPNIILNEIIDEFQIYKALIRVGSIDAALFRIDYLLDLANSAENLGLTIKDFRDYLVNVTLDSDSSIKYKTARGLGNCVKIMNIHKSKGLEFPICYFGGFRKKFNLKELNDRFMFDNKYGILTPFYKEGIGTLFVKTLIKNRYYISEISEKVRLFYVALTRAKEKMIMVMPEVVDEVNYNGLIPVEVQKNYRSFYDFMSSIKLTISKYIRMVNLEDIGISKDYQYVAFRKFKNKVEEKIEFRNPLVDITLVDNKHASKSINKVLTKEEANTLSFGTQIHEMLEFTDLKKESSNKYIKNLQDTFDFKKANIYQELEFMYSLEDTLYHGIIDLVLEYDEEIIIIDYKLKNILDEAYNKQLQVYYNYMRQVSDKDIKLYLYSVIDKTTREVKLVNIC